MAKMENLSLVEEEIFAFLREGVQAFAGEDQGGTGGTAGELKGYEKNRFETRAFVYLDIISWLESKSRMCRCRR